MNLTFNVPFMTISKFSQETGLSDSYIRKKVQKGIYPTLPKKSPNESTLINLVSLARGIELKETS